MVPCLSVLWQSAGSLLARQASSLLKLQPETARKGCLGGFVPGAFGSVWRCRSIAGVKPFELLGQTVSRDGSEMKLVRRGDEYLILFDGAVLMSSRVHGSEEALATFGCERARRLERPSVLIGGLGMGFTLRATLDLLPSDATVVVAELVPAVVEGNRGPLGPLAKEPLKDKPVRVETGDLGVVLCSRVSHFDAVLLALVNS